MKEREIPGSDVRDVSDQYGLIAVQGPKAIERLGLEHEPAFTFAMGEIDGVECAIARTGYTGEEGVELLVMAEDAVALWDAVLARGAEPCGLGARDTLRLEVCYPLHGNDITPETDAISAGLGWVCALDKEFTGRRAAAPGQGGGAGAPPRRLRHGGARGASGRNADRGGRRSDLGHTLASARAGDRPRVRPERALRSPTPRLRLTSAASRRRRASSRNRSTGEGSRKWQRAIRTS